MTRAARLAAACGLVLTIGAGLGQAATAPSRTAQAAPPAKAPTASQPAKPVPPKPAPVKPKSTAAAAPQKPAAPLVEKPVPFAPGETLTYDISWASFLTAATATVTVREKRASFDSTAYYIVAEGQPTALLSALYRLFYKADTLLDAFTLLPQRGSLYSREGGRQRLRSTRFEQQARTAQYDVQVASGANELRPDAQRLLTLPAHTQDPLSAIYVMRAMELKPGLTMAMPVSLNGDTLKVQVAVGDREPITSGVGELRCWKVTPTLFDAKGQPDPRKLTVWISDDARRLPVLLQAELPVGRFGLTLRDVSGR